LIFIDGVELQSRLAACLEILPGRVSRPAFGEQSWCARAAQTILKIIAPIVISVTAE
jgi:hypothetical protein